MLGRVPLVCAPGTSTLSLPGRGLVLLWACDREPHAAFPHLVNARELSIAALKRALGCLVGWSLRTRLPAAPGTPRSCQPTTAPLPPRPARATPPGRPPRRHRRGHALRDHTHQQHRGPAVLRGGRRGGGGAAGGAKLPGGAGPGGRFRGARLGRMVSPWFPCVVAGPWSCGMATARDVAGCDGMASRAGRTGGRSLPS